MNLKALRRQAGLTQAEAAKLVSRTRSTFAAYESGKIEPDPAVSELFRIKTRVLRKGRKELGL